MTAATSNDKQIAPVVHEAHFDGEPKRRRALAFTAEQKLILRDTYARNCSDQEFALFIATSEARGLDPFKRQIHVVKRYDSELGREVMSFQVAIDGFRALANDTGEYDGQDEPEFEYDAKGNLLLARVRVYRKGISRPFVGVARWSEYVQRKKNGDPNRMWATMPTGQLAKCAEALALRKAFPEDLGGLYTDEEMQQAMVAPDDDRAPAAAGPASADPPEIVKLRDMLSKATTEDYCKGVGRDLAAMERLMAGRLPKDAVQRFKGDLSAKRAELKLAASAAKDGGADAPNGAKPPPAPAGRTEAKPDGKTPEAGASPEPTANPTPPAAKSEPKAKAAGAEPSKAWPECGTMNGDCKCSRPKDHDGAHFDEMLDAEWPR